MTDIILAAVIFMCGGFIGFIMAAVFAVGRRSDEEFDGGFSANNPPARTRIWSDSVKSETRE